MFLNDGSIHEGNWANNKIEGRATITTQKGTTEIVRRNNRDIVIKKDSVYVSLDYALIDTENVEYLKLTNDDTKNTNFSSISKMQNLKGLTLTTTKSLSEILAIFDIPYLKYLHIQFISSSKETDSLPKQIGNLVYLEELELEGHRYAQIPKEISMLQVLKICNLIGQNNDETNALIIPDEFWSLSNLKELYLNGNKIKSLSKSIQNLTQLEILSLKENNLKTLPDEIGYLTKLKSLSLFHNNLSSLPSELGQLTQLEHLDISHNNLSNIPSSLCNLPNNYNTTIDLRMNSIGQSAANKLIQCLQKANVKY